MDSSLFVVHSESMMMCLMLLILLLIMELSTRHDVSSRRLIPAIYILVMLQLVIDAVWFVIDGNPQFILLHKSIQLTYLIVYPIIGFLWFCHCAQLLQDYWLTRSKTVRIVIIGLILVNAVLVALSWNRGYVFLVDEHNTYIRGPWLMFTNGITYSLMLLPTFLSLHAALRAKTVSKRRVLLMQSAYAAPVFIMGMLQLISPPGITCAYFGFVISFAMMMVSSLRQQITQDALTGLMNQNTLDKKLSEAVQHARRGEALIVCVGDLDRFKSINDSFGHTVGDEALVLTGKVLAQIAKDYDALVSRIHGDEFVLLLENKTEDEAKTMLEHITRQLEIASEDQKYRLEMSWGLARYVQGMSEKNLFEVADANLYEQKREKKGILAER